MRACRSLPSGLLIDPPPLVHPRIRANPLFTGREDLLAKLNVLLLDGPAKPAALLNVGGPSLGSNSMAAAKALGGLGGVGKTELAREFGWRNQSAYAGVWWIEAETRDGLLNGLIELGARFNPRIGEEKNREKAARASVEELENRGLEKPWLLIYDNAENPAAIDGWMPRAGAHCLITSRWRDWTGEADALRRGCVSARCRRGLSLRHVGALSATGPGTGRAARKGAWLSASRAQPRGGLLPGRAIRTSKTISKSWPSA